MQTVTTIGIHVGNGYDCSTPWSSRVFAGSEAGPLATLWDDRQLRLYTGVSSRPDISIWSCSGRQMGMILWEHGRVIAGGWTPDEQLVLVEADGKVG